MQKSKLMQSIAAATLLAATMTVSLTAAAQDKSAPPSAMPAPAAGAATAGAAVTDDVITANAKSALSADAQVATLPINVTTRKGVLVVSGEVPSAAAGERVLQIVAAVGGVKDVKNTLKVKGSS